jgi:hypothetical protein
MQNLTGTVGEGGANARHDVALVQALLVLIQRPAHLDPKKSKYLSAIDGECGDGTKEGIRRFQNDQVFGDAATGTSRAVAGATPGRIAPSDVTWTKLVAGAPTGFSDLRVLPGSKTAYIAATAAERDEALGLLDRFTFEDTFRAKVKEVVRVLHANTGLVASLCRWSETNCKAARRDFQTQYELLIDPTAPTSAGPGESNHNFGQAVDLGFKGLRWLRANGTVEEKESSWMHKLDPEQKATGESLFFWNVLRETGEQLGLFRGPESDRPHLQAWSDAKVSMPRRLVDLLNRVSVDRRMKWDVRWVKLEGKKKKVTRYQCDLGYGFDYFDVGSAAQIWTRQATINEQTLTAARAQAGRFATAMAVRSHGLAAPGLGASLGARGATPAVTAQDVVDMKNALRACFEAADRDWSRWTPS